MPKPIKLKMIGLDGNAFAIMGAFRRQAKKENWTESEINEVLTEAQKGDYHHLLATIMDNCKN